MSDSGDVLLPGALAIGEPVDWFFHRPLWLRTACCGEELWVYNTKHLAYLEGYVGANLRARRSTWSMGGRLPKWMTVANHRAEVLRCLRRLRERSGQDA